MCGSLWELLWLFFFLEKNKKNKREKRRYIVPIMTSENMACCVGRGTRHDSDGSSYRILCRGRQLVDEMSLVD